jgi:hypothetical protein
MRVARRAWRTLRGVAGGLAVASVFASGPGVAQARTLNLHGVADLTYRWSRIDQTVGGTDLAPSTTNGLQQHYQLGSTGDLAHPNVGSYTANISLIDDVNRINGGKTQDLTVKDYYFSLNLLPRATPVTFYAQRINQDNDALASLSSGTTSVTTTYSLTWDIPLQRLPRLRVNLFQSELQFDSAQVSSLQRTRAAALDADGQTGNTRYFARYQLTRLEGDTNGSTSHTVSASTETRFSPALTGAARVNYSSSVPTQGIVTPGLGTLLQRSAGASLYYRPSLQTTLTGSYDFYKDPFERHLLTTNATLRPTQDLDLMAGYRFFRFDVPAAVTDSHYGFAAANYRPMLRLSTNLSAALGTTDVRGATNVTSYYQNYGYGANYFETLTLLTYRLGYQGSYSANRLSTNSGTSRDLTNVFSAGVSNTQTRIVGVAADYTLSLVTHRTAGAAATDQRDHRLQVTANSSAPRDLFFPGDFLVLNALASYTLSDYLDVTDHLLLFSTTETYETGRGLATTVGYLYERRTLVNYDSKSISFIQVRWITYVVRNSTLDLNAKQSWERYAQRQPDVERSEGGAILTYQFGRITLSADYRLTLESRPDDRLLTQAAFLRAARPF